MASGNNNQSINPFDNFATAPAAPAGGGWGGGPSAGGAWGSAPAAPQQDTYDLETTYVPHQEAPSAWSNPQAAWMNTGAQPSASSSAFLLPSSDATVPSAMPPAAAPPLAFTNSTAAPVASGTIGKGPAAAAPGAPPPPGRDDGNFGVQQPPQPAASTSDTRPLLRADRPAEDPSKYPFYNIRKYRPYFNVDTKEVLWRVLSSFIGAFKPDFMEKTLEQPDLYGPFWVATTLIFVTAAAGNFSSYIEFKRDQNKDMSPPPPAMPPSSDPSVSPAPVPSPSPSPESEQWFADPTKLGTSAGIFYGYTFVISLLIWLWVKYLRGDIKLVNMFCVYGYAMTIFLPISAICIIPSDIVRWVVVMAGTLISGGFLFMNMRRTVTEVPMSKSIWVLGVVPALHIGLGIALKLFFFNY